MVGLFLALVQQFAPVCNVAQVGFLKFGADGLAKRGVLVRHLVMPGMAEQGTWPFCGLQLYILFIGSLSLARLQLEKVTARPVRRLFCHKAETFFLPNKPNPGAEIMRWLANEIGPDTYVHVMEQVCGTPRYSAAAAYFAIILTCLVMAHTKCFVALWQQCLSISTI